MRETSFKLTFFIICIVGICTFKGYDRFFGRTAVSMIKIGYNMCTTQCDHFGLFLISRYIFLSLCLRERHVHNPKTTIFSQIAYVLYKHIRRAISTRIRLFTYADPFSTTTTISHICDRNIRVFQSKNLYNIANEGVACFLYANLFRNKYFYYWHRRKKSPAPPSPSAAAL